MTDQDQIIDNIEVVTFTGPRGSRAVEAKVDTGAYRSSLDSGLAQELGLLDPANIVEYKKITNSLGESMRPVVHCQLQLATKQLTTEVGVIDRSSLRYRAIIGRKDLAGFLVRPDPHLNH